MQQNLVESRDGNLIFDQSQLIMYAVIAVGVILVLAVIMVAVKRRKKNFIKTVPTNLKEEE